MIERDLSLTLSDGKEYFIVDSKMYNDKNYVLINEYDQEKMELLDNTKIMEYNPLDNTFEKVTNMDLLKELVQILDDNDEELI